MEVEWAIPARYESHQPHKRPSSGGGLQDGYTGFRCPSTQFQPMPLGRIPAPFSHPDWVYEIKMGRVSRAALLQQKGRSARFSQL
jgi:hypothetical protein